MSSRSSGLGVEVVELEYSVLSADVALGTGRAGRRRFAMARPGPTVCQLVELGRDVGLA